MGLFDGIAPPYNANKTAGKTLEPVVATFVLRRIPRLCFTVTNG